MNKEKKTKVQHFLINPIKYSWKKKIKATSDQASKTTNSQVQETEEHVKQTKFLAFSMC